MARSSKPRKAYRPREININTVLFAAQGSSILPSTERERRLDIVQPAIEAILNGEAGAGQWKDLLAAFNMLTAIANIPGVLKGQPHVFCTEVGKVIEEVSSCWHEDNNYTPTASQADTLQALFDLFSSVLDNVPMRSIFRAEASVITRINRRDGITDLSKLGATT